MYCFPTELQFNKITIIIIIRFIIWHCFLKPILNNVNNVTHFLQCVAYSHFKTFVVLMAVLLWVFWHKNRNTKWGWKKIKMMKKCILFRGLPFKFHSVLNVFKYFKMHVAFVGENKMIIHFILRVDWLFSPVQSVPVLGLNQGPAGDV